MILLIIMMMIIIMMMMADDNYNNDDDLMILMMTEKTLLRNEIDGKCLMKCNTFEDVKEMGISMTIKASLLLDEIKKWKAADQDNSS